MQPSQQSSRLLSLGVHSALQDVTHSLAISRYGNSLAPLRCFAARDRRRTRTFSVDAETRRAGAALEVGIVPVLRYDGTMDVPSIVRAELAALQGLS